MFFVIALTYVILSIFVIPPRLHPDVADAEIPLLASSGPLALITYSAEDLSTQDNLKLAKVETHVFTFITEIIRLKNYESIKTLK